VIELRDCIDALRGQVDLSPYAYADQVVTPNVTIIRAIHVTDLRNALGAVYGAVALASPSYTDTDIFPGVTLIRTEHNAELRDGARALDLPTAAAPTYSPGGGTYFNDLTVTLSTATPDSVIRYTTDGSTPTSASPTYADAITVDVTMTTIRAKTFASGHLPSADSVADYTLQVAQPSLSPSGGAFFDTQTVMLSTDTNDGVIHFTIDSSDPPGLAPVYSGPLTLTESTTVRAEAFKAGYLDSDEASATYTLVDPASLPPGPSIEPDSGEFPIWQEVTLTTNEPNSTIWYTLDGTSPASSGGIIFNGTQYDGSLHLPQLGPVVVNAATFNPDNVPVGFSTATYDVVLGPTDQTLTDHRHNLISDWAARPHVVENYGDNVCMAWNALKPSGRQVFLWNTHRLHLSNMLPDVDELYSIRESEAGSCGGSEYNRTFMSMTSALQMTLTQVAESDDRQALPPWRVTHDLAGPHDPFTHSTETTGGEPRGQLHFFGYADPVRVARTFTGPHGVYCGEETLIVERNEVCEGCIGPAPDCTYNASYSDEIIEDVDEYYRGAVGYAIHDPYSFEMDQDYGPDHFSSPACFGYYRQYASNYGDPEYHWRPSGCQAGSTLPGALAPGAELLPNEVLWSPKGNYQLVYQNDDGNLVLKKANGEVVWASGTPAHVPGKVLMQLDGNLVILDFDGNPAGWATNTENNPGAYLQLYDDSDL
jgi:hypothetical protein